MKNIYAKFIWVLVPLFLILACEKERTPADTGISSQKYAVSFNVSGFSSDIKPMGLSTTRADGINSKLDRIYYLAYNSRGEEVSRKKQYYSDEKFGVLSDSLPAGTYTIVVIGSKSVIGHSGEVFLNDIRDDPKNPVKSNLTQAYFSAFVDLGGSFRTDDIFFKKFKTSVGGDSKGTTVQLKRLTGGLEINIEDAIPAEAKYFIVTVENELTKFSLEHETVDQSTNEEIYKEVEASHIGKPGFQIKSNMLNTVAYFNVIIQCFNSQDSLLSERIIEKQLIDVNKKLILSGRLFDNYTPGSKDINVSVNTGYDPENKTVKF